MMGRTLRVATRGSRLAMQQTALVVEMLRRQAGGLEFEVVPVTTHGDVASARWAGDRPAGAGAGGGEERPGEGAPADLPVGPGGTVGAFVKALEHALLEGRCDLAVHSLKDVPTQLPDALVLAAFPAREDPRDALVLAVAEGEQWPAAGRAPVDDAAGRLRELGAGARIGTSSMRRWVQVRMLHPEVRAVEVRGNVETRLRRLEEGRADALVLAAAGLHRLGLAGRVTAYFAPEAMVPAAGQGILAVECRRDDPEVLAVLGLLDRPELRAQAEAERAFQARTGAGCRWPVGALASVHGRSIRITGFLALPASEGRPQGWTAARGSLEVEAPGEEPQALVGSAARAGEALAERLLARVQAGQGEAVDAPFGV